MERSERMIHRLQELVWGPWMVAALLGLGVYFTVKSGFFQLRRFPVWWSETAGSLQRGEKEKTSGGISSFQTACTALAATIGTGNIVGVATALTAGDTGQPETGAAENFLTERFFFSILFHRIKGSSFH